MTPCVCILKQQHRIPKRRATHSPARQQHTVGIGYAGENALPRYDQRAYDTMVEQSAYGEEPLRAFTYLRLNDQLLQGDNWGRFRGFVADMQQL